MYDLARSSKTQVGLSRAKVRDNLLVMQAFSPALFGHGPPPGPHILMRLLRGDLARDQVDGEFDRLLEQKKLQGCETELLSMPWECKVTRLRVVRFLCLSPFACFTYTRLHREKHACRARSATLLCVRLIENIDTRTPWAARFHVWYN